MNDPRLFGLVREYAAEKPWQSPRFADRETAAFFLNDKEQPELPETIPEEPNAAVRQLRDHFDDDVALVSLFLHHAFPDHFVYWRLGDLERGALQALERFARFADDFEVSVDRVGRNDVDAYLEINGPMVELMGSAWPEADDPHACLQQFLVTLGMLFRDTDRSHHYWILCTSEPPGSSSDWSGTADVQVGDQVFFYQSGGPSAITDVFRVAAPPTFDPVGGWNGFWVELEHLGEIPAIGIGDMREDSTLADWSVVRRNFHGVDTEPIPYRIYNALVDYVPEGRRSELDLHPEAVDAAGLAGDYGTESEFEEE